MDCLRCKAMLKAIMAEKRPRALLKALEEGGMTTMENAQEPADGERPDSTLNIKCQACPNEGFAKRARAYMEAPPTSIILCANRLKDRAEMEEALVHELMHVYDHAVARKDLTDCQELAYSEIRAAREAECHYTPQICSWFRKQCVINTATRSTSTLFPDSGSDCVRAVFERAYHDTAPLSFNTPTTTDQPTTAVAAASLARTQTGGPAAFLGSALAACRRRQAEMPSGTEQRPGAS